MVKKGGLKEPRKYFSTLYYGGQESRTKLPTNDEQQELKLLKTDYEGKRYEVPEVMEHVLETKAMFEQIHDDYNTSPHITTENKNDMRWLREHSLLTSGNDYDYRFWLQYQVEEISAGNRSMRLVKSRSKEFRDAMSKLSKLTIKVSEHLHSMSLDVINSETTDNIHPLAHLFEVNDKVANDEIPNTLDTIMKKNFQYEINSKNNGLINYIKEKPLFYHLANSMLQVFFKSIRKSTKLKYFENKQQLIDALADINYTDVDDKTNEQLLSIMRNELAALRNKDAMEKYYVSKYVCETNSFFRKLHNKMGKVLAKWGGYYGWVPGRKKLDFFRVIYAMSGKTAQEQFIEEDLAEARNKFRMLSVKTAVSCLTSASMADLVYFDAASVDELDSLYEDEYEHSGTSYPNVIRMSSMLYDSLNQGDHAIIRHFQMDEKRNMYCLAKPHAPFLIGQRGNGGFLHNESMSVSLHPALLSLIEEKRLFHTRFEPVQETFTALNVLQQTQWSINLDFLDFIADFTFEGLKISPYPVNIRQSAWQRSDNMALREVFVEKMLLRGQDIATKSRFRNIKANLKQARKNLFNSGNVFWHPWFCDWRGRFNTKVNELSPQGDDLSKAMLLFTEWKPLGDIGRNWLYVRAYELLRKILTPDLDKIDEFDQQIDWVEQRLTDIVTLGKKLNRSTNEVELEEVLDQLQVKKPAPKSEIFQRIAFLIEFARIHETYRVEQDWSKVKSGLPVHLDASCNGFQHIAALTRNEKLAKSVNILNNPDNSKGDLYQEVATKAKESLHNDWEESEHVRKIIEQICSSENSKQILTNGIFTRDFCKPLVMITGYGATDLKSQIMNLNGKKLRSGRFKPSKNENSIPTLHHESLLYQVVQQLQEAHGGYGKLILKKDEQGYMIPAGNAMLARKFGHALGDYIHKCIGEVTDFKFDEVKECLGIIYNQIDTLGVYSPGQIKKIDEYNSNELKQILSENGLPYAKLNKSARQEAVKKLLVEKWKNKLYFSWQASTHSPIIRYIKWKLDNNRGQAILPTAILPKSYVDPGQVAIEQFIINSKTLKKELKDRVKNQRFKIIELSKIKKQVNQSQSIRNLKNLVLMCLRNITLRSKDEEEKAEAKNHYYARFIELTKKRTHDGKKNDHRFALNTGNDMKLDHSKPDSLKQSITKLCNLSDEITLGMVPNFIHSFDALHMQNVILELNKHGIEDIWTIHDSFGVHPCHVETLRDIVNRTFVKLHQDPLDVHLKRIIELNSDILTEEFLTNHEEFIEHFSHQETKSPQNDWINKVLGANYLIS